MVSNSSLYTTVAIVLNLCYTRVFCCQLQGLESVVLGHELIQFGVQLGHDGFNYD